MYYLVLFDQKHLTDPEVSPGLQLIKIKPASQIIRAESTGMISLVHMICDQNGDLSSMQIVYFDTGICRSWQGESDCCREVERIGVIIHQEIAGICMAAHRSHRFHLPHIDLSRAMNRVTAGVVHIMQPVAVQRSGCRLPVGIAVSPSG